MYYSSSLLFFSPTPLSDSPVLPHNVPGPLDDLIKSLSVLHPQDSASAENSVQDVTGHHSLIEHPQHRPADDEGP